MRCFALLLAAQAQASRLFALGGADVAVRTPRARSSAPAELSSAGFATAGPRATPAPVMREPDARFPAAALLAAGALLSRRGFLRLGAAGLAAAPAAPALARSKSSMSPNKPEGVGANAGQYMSEYRKKEYSEMKGDKGSRGVASASFDKNDTVQYNRDKNGGLARDANGRKIVVSDRNRDPAELGLKQWDGT